MTNSVKKMPKPVGRVARGPVVKKGRKMPVSRGTITEEEIRSLKEALQEYEECKGDWSKDH